MERIELLPIVKAYPALSKSYGEVSCVAGVQTASNGSPRWIRLYPVPFRALKDAQKFAKYEPISVEVETHNGDRRPETRRPNRDSIKVTGSKLPTDNGWKARRGFIEPLLAESMCEIRRRQQRDGTSLGIFRPATVDALLVERADVSAEKQRMAEQWAAQGTLLDDTPDRDAEHEQQMRSLELIPYSFKYRYRCSDSGCKGHEQSIIDWEIGQSYRRDRKRSDWEARIRNKWLEQVCGADRDTAFIVGNQHQHPGSFLVLGVWWPPKLAPPAQAELPNFSDA